MNPTNSSLVKVKDGLWTIWQTSTIRPGYILSNRYAGKVGLVIFQCKYSSDDVGILIEGEIIEIRRASLTVLKNGDEGG